MKTPSSALYDLIHSLSKTEKRYFKTQAQRHVIGKRNRYVEMFDAIAAQNSFDEEKLKKKLAKVVTIRHWASTKKYLYEQLLDSLHQFHLTHSVQEKIKQSIHVVHILVGKHLYKQAKKLIDKTEKQIETYALYEYMPELLEAKRKFLQDQSQKKSVKERTVRLVHSQMKKALRQIEDKDKIAMLGSLLNYSLTKRGKNEEIKEIFDALMIDEVLQVSADHENIQLYPHAQHVHAMHHSLNGDYEKALEHTQEVIKHYDEHKKLISLDGDKYLAAYDNLVNFAFQCQKDKEAAIFIKDFLELPSHPVLKRIPGISAMVFGRGYVLLLNVYLLNGVFDKAQDLVDVVEKGIKKHAKDMQVLHKVNLQVLSALTYFLAGDFEAACAWADKVLSLKDRTVLEELYPAADVLHLLALYEQGDHETVGKRLRSIKRRQKKEGAKVYKVEKSLVYHLNKLINAPTRKEQKVLYELWLEDIEGLKSDTEENTPFQFFYYIPWLKSKIENEPIEEVFEQADADWREV